MLRIKKIKINGIGPIFDLKLQFNPNFNIICGSNGIGKTTVLECIAQTFNFSDYTLRRNTKCQDGEWTTTFEDGNGDDNTKTTRIRVSKPYEKTEQFFQYKDDAVNLIYYKTNRVLPYINVDSVAKDPNHDKFAVSHQTNQGTSPDEIKKWFINRFLWSRHENSLCKEQLDNLELAKGVFRTMADGFSFERVDPESFDIILNTPKGQIVLEQLSSGFISYVIVLLGIIKDVEYRFKAPHICIKDFDGVLVVDEIDVHLHPELQAKIYLALKDLLPKAQIFTSTHSPHVIQVADAKEIIPLVAETDGNVNINPVVNTDFGCQGWTIEEILVDVMGMKCTRSAKYDVALRNFNEALADGDSTRAHQAYDTLCKMLHPDNVLRKILEIQMVEVG